MGNREAGRRNDIPEPCVRRWRDQENSLRLHASVRAKRVIRQKPGPKINMNMELELVAWINMLRECRAPVSRHAIMAKARSYPGTKEGFVASRGWLEKFLARNGFSLRRRTTQGQGEPADLIESASGSCF